MAKRKTVKQSDLRAQKLDKDYAELTRIIFYFCLAIFTAIAAFDIFTDLSFSGIIMEWDEARHGVNAYEMLQSGNFIVNTYQYAPDYWNVKPPLSMWQVAVAYKLFGYSTFSLRFFSALYLPLIVAISMLVLNKYVGVICSIVTGFLFATTGTRFFHLFKSGDPDALFFFMCFLACVFLYMAYKEKRIYLVGAGICTAFAFLTKAMHVISLFAVIAVYLIFILKNRAFSVKQLILYLFVPMAVPVMIWATLRASYDGVEFFRQMYLLDVLNRVTEVVENHAGGPTFYIAALKFVLGGFMFYGIILLIVVGIVVSLTQEKDLNTDKTFLIIFGTMALAPIIIFTMSTTKLAWYVFPCMIGICFIAGYSAQKILDIFMLHKRYVHSAVCLLVCAVFLLIGGFNKPFKGNINLLTTNVMSSGNLFSQVQLTPDTEFLVVNSQGARADGMMISWLLEAYYLGLEYVPYGMEQYGHLDNAIVILRHTDAAHVEDFLSVYPQLEEVAQASDYTGTIYTMLK